MSGVSNNILVPGAYVNISNERAGNAFAPVPFRTVILGEHVYDDPGGNMFVGSVSTAQILRIVSEAQAFEYYGKSPSYEMCRSFLRGSPYDELYCISLPTKTDAGTTEADPIVIVVSINGSVALESGTLVVNANGFKQSVYINKTDTTGVIASKISDAIINTSQSQYAALNASTLSIYPSAGGLGTASFLNSGVAAQMFVKIDGYVNGPLFAVDGGTASMNVPITYHGENSAVDITDHLAALPDQMYSLFVCPYNDDTNISALIEEVERRFTPEVQLEGHILSALKGSYNTIISDLEDYYNNQHLNILHAGFKRPATEFNQAAACAAQIAKYLGQDPAVPMQDIILTGIEAEEPIYRMLFTEQNGILGAGGSTTSVNSNGDVLIQRLCTTYTKNTADIPDVSYRDIQTILTASYDRQTLVRTIRLAFPNYKLADDGQQFEEGQKIATPGAIQGEILAWYQALVDRGLAENFAAFKDALIVRRSTVDRNRVDAILPVDMMNQFMVFGGDIQFIL